MLNDMALVDQVLVAFKSQDRDRLVSLLRELKARNANLGADWGKIARIATTIGEVGLALDAAGRYGDSAPVDPQTRLSQAGIMAELGAIGAAISVIKPLTAKKPDNAALFHFLGTAQSQIGDSKASLKNLRRALKIWETSGHTWLTLAALKKFSPSDPELQKLKQLRGVMESTPLKVRAAYLYALAKAFDDTEETDLALAHYAEGATLMRQDRPYDAGRDLNFAHRLIQDFTPAALSTLRPSNVTDNRPIFVLGWPRTGTTLMEQILTSHSNVADGGEINLFQTAIMPLKGFSVDHAKAYEQRHQGEKNPWQPIAETYLHLISERFGQEQRIIDKSLNNGRFLGLIHHIFPKAPIIWMRRNPEDAAWSCFKTFFNQGLEWSWSFDHIAHHFRAEDELRQHWMTLYPEAILEVPYEELVSTPDDWIPKILTHCGLAYEKKVMTFHKTKRAVLTSSVAQVRKPLTRTSINAAGRYAPYLKPFRDIYYTP
ncbi:sulfotransferase [Paremcibacter congregatus]|uniref:sulfotransferase n=1 Tax=Paremcibacter congregatus TaxID=2043170 RepID=UPI0030EBF14D|tara:strand:- start:816 stop:2276 length:1461 start_codon:yes stop_codon:yes gene_type:complete